MRSHRPMHPKRGPLAPLALLALALLLAASPLPAIGAAWALAGPTWGNPPGPSAIREHSRGTFAPAPRHEQLAIHLSQGYRFDPLADGEPALASALRSPAHGAGMKGSFLVQLKGPVTTAQRAAIEASGAALFGYVPDYAFLVRMDGAARAAVGALPFVRWTGDFHPAYKLSPATEMSSVGVQALVVLLVPDADIAAAAAAIHALGGAVLRSRDSGRNKILHVELDMSRLTALAALDAVAWIEPRPAYTTENDRSQWVVQTNVNGSRPIWDAGLQGEAQVVHAGDSGIRTSHNMFRDAAVSITDYGHYPTHRKIIAYETPTAQPFGDASGASNHGTHTGGTLVGDDSPFASDARDGIAPKAKIFFSDLGGAASSIFPPDDLNDLFQPCYDGNAGGAARISSNSWSAPTNLYTVDAMNADQFMWDHKDFLVFFSTGNNAAPAVCGSPATCKSGVGAGGTENGTSSNIWYPFTSEGPTSDGRLKPTICAPADALSSADGAGDTGYKNLSGTSMACPSMASATLLIRQYFTEGWYPTGAPNAAHAFTPSGALLKAMGINSTDNDMTGFNVPNNSVGWGRIKLKNVLYLSGGSQRLAVVDDPDGLATGEFVEYEIDITVGSVPFKLALCWSDRAGTAAAGAQIVNDLDLVVTDPGGIVFYQGNSFAGGQSTVGGAPDLLNVEECVRVNAPTTGTWTIRVSGENVPMGPQPFALAVTGGFAEPPPPVSVGDGFERRVVTLGNSAPNPFAGSTSIGYSIDTAGRVELAVYGVRGERVRSLVSGRQAAGHHSVAWDGRDHAGNAVGSGLYFFRLESGGVTATRRTIRVH